MTEWVPVSSTAIRKIGYDLSSKKMYIDFEDSDPYYTYCNVPETLFRQFLSSSSVGRFYHQYVKNQYNC